MYASKSDLLHSNQPLTPSTECGMMILSTNSFYMSFMDNRSIRVVIDRYSSNNFFFTVTDIRTTYTAYIQSKIDYNSYV